MVDPIRPGGVPPFAPPPRPQAEVQRGPGDGFAPGEVRPGHGVPCFEEVFELIHPGTPELFRTLLEGYLNELPSGLLRRIAEQGYRIHVISREHPLTLGLEEPVGLEDVCLPAARSLREIALERGLPIEAFVPTVLEANPELQVIAHTPEETPFWTGRLPAMYGWGTQRLTPQAWRLLAEPGNKAGLVLHGAVPGLSGEGLRILFWDRYFYDPLAEWYVLHEMGHTTDYAFAFRAPERWRAWRAQLQDLYDERCFVTRYAGESITEFFAESFAAWGRRYPPTDPGFAESDLGRQRHQAWRGSLSPRLCALIEAIVNEP